MLTLESLSKFHRTDTVETTALDQIDLHIEQGEFVSIMGPSGCGKSTLLSILGLLDAPSAGNYRFMGQEVAGYNERQRADLRKNVGFVFQSFNLLDDLTVAENVELALQYHGIAARERKVRAASALERLNLAGRANHFPKQLSGGQQQRVAIARATVGNPPILFADEPTGNLDSTNGEEVMQLLTALNAAGTTIVMVTHSPEHATYGNRVITLLDGKCVAVPATAQAPALQAAA
ncbi:phosphonate ABC transporter ATP-binding protein [Duganella sp. Leaf61]|uniref:ABC transporter ATP-binding protein n=1 Tax=Duganella sp. Leaf61 TaxID=1736227 RepID=UPI0006F64800|nr:ABC transporter ATP-binding protein [Duganella sp. Leaf61]KQN76029.1 phosphonate ABC transporter ATP-binding protein [Duganella sp. Leaf61]